MKIQNQEWMVENLDVSTFRNGDSIPEAKSTEDWAKASEEKKPVWCYYENDSNNAVKYGKLYNWFAVIDKRGLAPKGWHISRNTDWDLLANSLGGTKITYDGYQFNSLNKNEESVKLITDFLGLPSGNRDLYLPPFFRNKSTFIDKLEAEEQYATWWAMKFNGKNLGWRNYFIFRFGSNYLTTIQDCHAGEGHSIRCVKN